MQTPPNHDPARARLATRIRTFLGEERWEFPAQERSASAGSPATPEHAPVLRATYAGVGLLVGLTAGLGGALVMINAQALAEATGLSAVEAAWLPTVYAMTNISANLLLIKFRQQYGLRPFALIFLGLYAALSITHLLASDLWVALAARAASGFVAAALTPLTLFYVAQAFPARWHVKAMVVGIGISQCAVPLARLLSPELMAASGRDSLFLFESGLALLALAAVGTVRLPPAERRKVFEPLDILTFFLMGGGLALVTAVLGLGRLKGWGDAPWIVWSLFAALLILVLAAAVELARTSPLLDLRWLIKGDVARFAVATFMARIVLVEQNVAAGYLIAVGVDSREIEKLFIVIFFGTVAGVLASAVTLNAERLARPMLLAIAVVAVAIFADSSSASSTSMPRFYVSQFAIAFGGSFFLGPALLLGITNALQRGNRELISFTVLFGVINAIGALAGPALFGTYIDGAVAADGAAANVRAHLEVLSLIAILAALTGAYLAVLLALRIRRRLAELRIEAGRAIQAPIPGETGGPSSHAPGARWRPGRASLAAQLVMGTVATTGLLLMLAALQ